MSEIEFCLLPPSCQPLLGKFYRDHHSRMRSSGAEQMWVAKQQEIIGALNLKPVANGHWLTGLFVAPQWRGQAVAGRLINSALAGLTQPVWLFCHPELVEFYERSGFAPTTQLPPVLTLKLMRYQRTKEMVAMVAAGPAQPGERRS